MLYRRGVIFKMKYLTLVILCVLSILEASAENLAQVVIGNSGEPATLDPHKYNLRLEETLLNDLFLGLTTFNAKGEIVPGAAKSWTASEDGLTWTFTLRDDLKWSDGKALNAEDFVFSLRRLQDPKTAASLSYFLYMIKNAEAVNKGERPIESLGVHAKGSHTLIIELEKPYPYLLERLLYPTGFPVPKHAIEAFGDNWVKPKNWVSNGAFVLSDWSPQEHVQLEANDYFHEPVSIRSAKYLPVASEQSGFNRFRTGELHAIASFPAGEIEGFEKDGAAELRMSDLLSMIYLVFNTQAGPTKDVKIRQALSLAVDQDIITQKVLRNGSKSAFSFVPNLVSNYSEANLPHHQLSKSERKDQAIELLKSAGHDNDNPLRLKLHHAAGAENKKVNLAIMGMWNQIGVITSLQQSDLKTHFGTLRQNDFQVGWAGWIGENNAEHYLELLDSNIGDVNYGRYANSLFDQAINQARSELTIADRNTQLALAEKLAVADYPVVPLYTLKTRRLVHQKLKGWSENLRDVHQIRYLSWE